ncbi:SLC13 family permease [Gudongella sp. DL1XJH-153]|uniref:SLC13 family permease n=1 Tax=Gudongella sp. DL1XJH-153 TaxID=3409804 RepID=UPI003BB58A55
MFLNRQKPSKTIFHIFICIILILGILVSTIDTPVFAATGKNMESLKSKTLTSGIVVILALVLVLMLLFFLEPVPLDIIAISIPVILIILKPWTNLTVAESLSGFSNKATLTVLAMFIVSGAVRKSGLVKMISNLIIKNTGNNTFKQLSFIAVLSGILSAFLNNTPVVAIFTPMIITMTRRTKSSPSKLLIPLSYASMMGGMLTLIGTSTNILASDVSDRLIGQPFSMFEFTQLGIVVFFFGVLYLVIIGHRLLPERISSDQSLTKEYFADNFLTEIVIRKESSLIGSSIDKILEKNDLDIEVVQLISSKDETPATSISKPLEAEDRIILRTDLDNLQSIRKIDGVRLLAEVKAEEKAMEISNDWDKYIEVVVLPASIVEGQTLDHLGFFKDYQALAFAVRRGNKLIHKSISEIKLKAGDRILLLGSSNTYKMISKSKNLIVIAEVESDDVNYSKIILTLSILAGVIVLAVMGILPIVLSAFLGVVLMVTTGCIKPPEIYEYVNWQTIFLLAGLIPLGLALEKTGAAEYLTIQLLNVIKDLPNLVILGIFYLFTATVTNIISNNASVILMLPIAVGIAEQLGVNPFAFVIAVTFAASTAFLTPMGYQTNLMVYSSGGYKFKDYFLVGAPLQILLAIVTPIFIAVFWGL